MSQLRQNTTQLRSSTNKTKKANSAHLERELVHEVDLVGVGDVAVLEVLDRHGERGAEEADLPLPGAVVHQLLQHGLELGREELVRLIKRKRAENNQVNRAFVNGQVIEEPCSRETSFVLRAPGERNTSTG